MEENRETDEMIESSENVNEEVSGIAVAEDKPLDKNVKLMSPTRMVLRRFFRSKLSIVGLVMLAALLLFCWIGPFVYPVYKEDTVDRSGRYEYTAYDVSSDNGE